MNHILVVLIFVIVMAWRSHGVNNADLVRNLRSEQFINNKIYLLFLLSTHA